MYLPTHFAEIRPEHLHALIIAQPLGMLVSHSSAGLDAEHLPFFLHPEEGTLGVLRAHVARNNPLWQRCPSGTDVMVVFRGAEGYISPNGYPSKHETHRQVPTWNYQVVHAHGTLRVHDDERFVRSVVARLTHRHEAKQPRPWRMGDAPPDYLAGMLRQIVGIEVQIQRLEGKSKLSQNKELRDRLGTAEALEAQGQVALAQAVRRTLD